MSKWGTMNIKIQFGTYTPPHTKREIMEINLLSDDNEEPDTSIQEGGQSRKRCDFSVIADSMQVYRDMEEDYIKLIEKEFIGPDGSSFVAFIEDIGEPSYIPGQVIFTVNLLEA